MLLFKFETPDRIKSGIGECTDLSYLIGSYERYRYGNLDGSFYGISLVIEDGIVLISYDISLFGFKLGVDKVTELYFYLDPLKDQNSSIYMVDLM